MLLCVAPRIILDFFMVGMVNHQFNGEQYVKDFIHTLLHLNGYNKTALCPLILFATKLCVTRDADEI